MSEHIPTLASRDEFISMKMLVRFKELRRAEPKKPFPDVGWMQELLDASREADARYEDYLMRHRGYVPGVFCAECLKPQRSTPSGLVCENGHGGVESISEDEVEMRRRMS